PVFTEAAWYDIFLGGSLTNFVRLQKEAGTGTERRGQKLYVGAGGHAGGWGGRNGALDFCGKGRFGPQQLNVGWCSHPLKGEANGAENDKPVKIFVMGKNIWRDEDNWPLARAQSTKYFLHSHGAANGISGDGTLSTAMPAAEQRDTFNYDPENPTPTIG